MMSSLLFLLLLLLFLTPASTLEFRYHSNREVEEYLLQINASNTDITHLYSIGPSVRGQQLWVLALGVTPDRHTVGIPEFKYVANMHGNEVLGRVLLLQLINDLVHGYRNNETWSLRLLSSTRIHIMPTMNPDGFSDAGTHCQYSQGRFNHNGVDLNRNFPDAFAGVRRKTPPDDEKREAEVRAVIGWLKTESFVLSANLHGGALVASYPYDNSNGGTELVGGASISPDDDVFLHLAKVYSHNHASMHLGDRCDDTSNGGSELVGGASISPDDDVFLHLAKVYSHNHASMHLGDRCDDTRPFLDGVTNGYLWYPLSGGMQDYNYVWAQCLELTLEVSCCKFPPVGELPALWEDNRKSLLAFIQQVHLGVKGRVLDGSGVPVQNAVVDVKGRRNMCPFRTDRHGEYYRLLLPGKYSFMVTYPGHEVLTETLTVPYGPGLYSALKHDFLLKRSVATTIGTASYATQASPSPTCNHTLLPQAGAAPVPGPSWTGLVLGLGLATKLRSLID